MDRLPSPYPCRIPSDLALRRQYGTVPQHPAAPAGAGCRDTVMDQKGLPLRDTPPAMEAWAGVWLLSLMLSFARILLPKDSE